MSRSRARAAAGSSSGTRGAAVAGQSTRPSRWAAAGGEEPAPIHAVVVEAVRAGTPARAVRARRRVGVEALRAGDAEAAETAVHRHFDDARGRPAPHRARPSFV
ncbi:hypothetical protein [Streptomyces mayonensis]|uniref:hypothetical protein n=1 Tax=Streptomyces mayonensis TaxID=2750816 RepID=UPI0020A6665B|nr:hypothetical protein [Streptomyces sp. A108]